MIPYGRQDIRQEDIEAVVEALKSDYLTTGPLVEKFEEKLCEISGAKFAVVCSNATNGLHLACKALGLEKGAKGITSAITFLASANCMEYCDLQVDFLDINPSTYCMPAEKLEEYCKIAGAPQLVIPVSFAGLTGELPQIWNLAKQYGMKVIEDAAHSIGSSYQFEGKSYQSGSCTHSDLAVYSFHPVKNITTGEGGAVLTNDSELAEKVRLLRSHNMQRNVDPAQPWYYEMQNPGFNYRLTDIQAALGISQLNRLQEIKAQRNEIVRQYNSAFRDLTEITTPDYPQDQHPCPHIYPILVKSGAARRRELQSLLLENEVGTQVHYFPVHLQPYYSKKYGYSVGKCPVAEQYYEQTLSLPLFAALGAEQVEKIISLVREFFSEE